MTAVRAGVGKAEPPRCKPKLLARLFLSLFRAGCGCRPNFSSLGLSSFGELPSCCKLFRSSHESNPSDDSLCSWSLAAIRPARARRQPIDERGKKAEFRRLSSLFVGITAPGLFVILSASVTHCATCSFVAVCGCTDSSAAPACARAMTT